MKNVDGSTVKAGGKKLAKGLEKSREIVENIDKDKMKERSSQLAQKGREFVDNMDKEQFKERAKQVAQGVKVLRQINENQSRAKQVAEGVKVLRQINENQSRESIEIIAYIIYRCNFNIAF